jgi:hypothetical protein
MKHSGMVLRTEQDKLVVHLGPAWYFWEHDFPIRVGDVLEVYGSKMKTSRHSGIIRAEKLRKNGKILKVPKKF